MTEKKRALYLSNGEVAWQIPPGKIARFYRGGLYHPPPGWTVVPAKEIKDFTPGRCGILREAIS